MKNKFFKKLNLKCETRAHLVRIFTLLLFLVAQSANLLAQSKKEVLQVDTKDDLQFVGVLVNENDKQIFLAILHTKDTISISKSNLKGIYVIDTYTGESIDEQAILGDREYETITYSNGSVYKGTMISEDDRRILFELYTIKDTLLLEKKHIAKYINRKDHFIYSKGRYHKKNGLVTSLRLLGSVALENGMIQTEISMHKFINPKYAIGVGVGLMAGSYEYEDYAFREVFVYGRSYLNQNRKRLFFEAKIGASFKRQSDQVYEREIYDAYTSGPQLQYGIGIDFANTRSRKWTLHIGHLLQVTNTEFQTITSGGIINLSEREIINFPTLGMSLNF